MCIRDSFQRIYYKDETPSKFIPLHISIGSTNQPAYLEEWKIKVSYNPAAFGENILHTNNLKYQVLQEDRKSKSGNLMQVFQVPSGYAIDLKQVSEDAFTISWKKDDQDSEYFQILPVGIKPFTAGIPLIDLNFAILTDSVSADFEIEFVDQPKAVDLKTGAKQVFDYTYSSPNLTDVINTYRPIEILDFFPKKAIIGDTITITGKYMKSSKVSLFGKSNTGRGFYGHIPTKNIIEESPSKIRFIIPTILERPDWLGATFKEWFTPVTNIIFLNKKMENHIGLGGKTKEKLEIKE